MKRAISIRRIGKTAGTVVLGLILLDLLATAVTIGLGAEWLRR